MPTATAAPKQKVPATQAQDSQARISALLKQADHDVKLKQFEAALAKVRQVYEIAPANMYARAYEERIEALSREQQVPVKEEHASDNGHDVTTEVRDLVQQQQEEAGKRKIQERQEQELERQARQAATSERTALVERDFSTLEAETLKRVEQTEQQLVEQMQRSIEEERRRMTAQSEEMIKEMRSMIDQSRKDGDKPHFDEKALIEKLKHEYANDFLEAKQQFKLELIAKSAAERRSIESELLQKMKVERNKAEQELLHRMEEERDSIIRQERSKAKERGLDAYRSLLLLLARLRLPSEAHQAIVRVVQTGIGIDDNEHARVQHSVGADAFIAAVRDTMNKGTASREELEVLRNLAALYNVTPAEQREIERRVQQELGIPSVRHSILVLDDESFILQFAEAILKQTYEIVRTAGTVPEAVKLMNESKPSLVIADVNLSDPAVSGFSFCEKMLSGEYGEGLRDVPFLIMSAVADDFFVKSARQLGAKGYLAKPFTREKLESMVRAALNGQSVTTS